MDETIGLRLIEELKNDPEKFSREKKTWKLIEEYWHGLSTNTLCELFHHENILVRQIAIYITSELVEVGSDLLRACLKSRSRQYFGQICAPLRQKYLSYVSKTAYFFLAAHQICRKILLAPRI